MPALVLLLVMATVHLIRGAPVDAVITYAVAAALAVDRALIARRTTPRSSTTPSSPPSRRTAPAMVPALLVAVAFGWSTSHWALYDRRTGIVIAVLGAAVAVLAFARHPIPSPATPPPTRPTPSPHTTSGQPAVRPRRAWPWAAVAVAICLLELASFLLQPDLRTGSYDHPTISYLAESLLADPPVRGLAAAAWLLAGYLLLRRSGLLGGLR